MGFCNIRAFMKLVVSLVAEDNGRKAPLLPPLSVSGPK